MARLSFDDRVWLNTYKPSDMKDLDSPDPILRHQLARDIRDACINVGFFYGKRRVSLQ